MLNRPAKLQRLAIILIFYMQHSERKQQRHLEKTMLNLWAGWSVPVLLA